MNENTAIEIAELKKQFRKQSRQTRQALSEEFRAQASLDICARIAALPIFASAQVILTYMPIKGEVDLRSLIENQPAKTWVLPRILAEPEHGMSFHVHNARQLIIHPFGMAEPDSRLPRVQPGEIQLALVPGLAYDRRGWRLGYGGGYYDRFLKEFNGYSLGVTYEALLVPELPHGSHDMAMRGIVTEAGIHEVILSSTLF